MREHPALPELKSAAGGDFRAYFRRVFQVNGVMRTMKNLVRQVSKREAVFLVLDNHVGPRDSVYKSSEAFLGDPELTGSPVLSDPFDCPFP